MKILVADDDFDLRLMLHSTLPRWGYDVINASDGIEAWQVLQGANPPRLAILDWMMPGLDGLEVCKLARDHPGTAAAYILMLTARSGTEDMVTGLLNGVDEYLVKPVELDELRGRLHAARRIVELQEQLEQRVGELQQALARVRQLQGLLPVCSSCKKVRDDQNYWRQVEETLSALSGARLSQGICPDCLNRVRAAEADPPHQAGEKMPPG